MWKARDKSNWLSNHINMIAGNMVETVKTKGEEYTRELLKSYGWSDENTEKIIKRAKGIK